LRPKRRERLRRLGFALFIAYNQSSLCLVLHFLEGTDSPAPLQKWVSHVVKTTLKRIQHDTHQVEFMSYLFFGDSTIGRRRPNTSA
jgi:hypothetical protein